MNPRPSPEERAAERYPDIASVDNVTTDTFLSNSRIFERSGFATCYREEVEPRDRLIQELVDALNRTKIRLLTYRDGQHGQTVFVANDALAAAKAIGITPNPS